jgi:hypothetical protein
MYLNFKADNCLQSEEFSKGVEKKLKSEPLSDLSKIYEFVSKKSEPS